MTPTSEALDALLHKLRTTSTKRTWDSVGRPYDYPEHIPHEAADAIEALRSQVEALTGERDNLVLGLNSIVNCKSTVTRPALREAAAEVLGKRTQGWPEDQSPFAALAHEATSRALAAETALAEASDQLSAVLLWSREPCPCKDEKPDPCPLCGASVADGTCKAGTRLPDLLWGRINLAIAQARIARGPDHG